MVLGPPLLGTALGARLAPPARPTATLDGERLDRLGLAAPGAAPFRGVQRVAAVEARGRGCINFGRSLVLSPMLAYISPSQVDISRARVAAGGSGGFTSPLFAAPSSLALRGVQRPGRAPDRRCRGSAPRRRAWASRDGWPAGSPACWIARRHKSSGDGSGSAARLVQIPASRVAGAVNPVRPVIAGAIQRGGVDGPGHRRASRIEPSSRLTGRQTWTSIPQAARSDSQAS